MARLSMIDMFTHMRGVTPQHVLTHGHENLFGRHYTFDDLRNIIAEHPAAHTEIHRQALENGLSQQREALDTPHHELVQRALADWRHGSDMFVGNPYHVAARVLALDKELRENGKPNEVPLYRGGSAFRTPNMDLVPGTPVSFSENRDAADIFAGVARRDTGSGRVFTVKPGEAQGIRMEDYGVRPMEVRHRSEAEWLVTHLGRQWNPKAPK